SMRNLHDPGLPEAVDGLLHKWQVDPPWLTLELTESAVMGDTGRAMETLGALRGLGVHMAIDDFGTGYSSLGYLKRLPVHQIKIDKSFVLNMASDESDAMIVRSTIDLARNLGLLVVAEGVEDQATLERLAALGCDAIQGYHLA